MNGHSFGGITSMAVASEDERIKACLTLDPWFFPITDELHSLDIKVPLQTLMTEKMNAWCASWGFN